MEELSNSIARHNAVALRVYLLPKAFDYVFENIGGGEARVIAVEIFVSLTLSVILDKLAKVLEAHIIIEIWVHDLKLYLGIFRSGFNTLSRKSFFDLILRDFHLFWMVWTALSSTGDESLELWISAVVLGRFLCLFWSLNFRR